MHVFLKINKTLRKYNNKKIVKYIFFQKYFYIISDYVRYYISKKVNTFLEINCQITCKRTNMYFTNIINDLKKL